MNKKRYTSEELKQHKRDYWKIYFADPEHKRKQREAAKKCMRKLRSKQKALYGARAP